MGNTHSLKSPYADGVEPTVRNIERLECVDQVQPGKTHHGPRRPGTGYLTSISKEWNNKIGAQVAGSGGLTQDVVVTIDRSASFKTRQKVMGKLRSWLRK